MLNLLLGFRFYLLHELLTLLLQYELGLLGLLSIFLQRYM